MKLTPKGYMPRLIDKEIEENLKIYFRKSEYIVKVKNFMVYSIFILL
ncbi:MAG: hypothetical protein ACLU33_04050 [Christensenellales bacterium]